MKKLYLFILAILALSLAYSQSNNYVSKSKFNLDYISGHEYKPLIQNTTSRASMDRALINFSYALSLTTDSLPLEGWVYLFPDTMARINYAGTDYSFWRFTDRYHSAGDVLDLSSTIFNSMVDGAFNETNSYAVDSVYIGYYYNRNITNVTDTVRIYVSVEDGLDFKKGSEEEPYPLLAYNQSQNAPETYLKAIDILIDQNDTAWYGNSYLGVPLNIELEANQLMSIVINYIPGYAYDASSNYFDDLNPFILSCSKELKSRTGHMMSMNLESTMRYNQGLFSDFYQVYGLNIGAGEVWNTRYASAYANEYWTKYDGENISTRYNHLDTWYVVSSLDDDQVVGMDSYNNSIQMYPNPSKGSLIIELSENAPSIEIFNALGTRVYANLNPASKNTIDINHLEAGVYFVKVNGHIQSIIKQ